MDDKIATEMVLQGIDSGKPPSPRQVRRMEMAARVERLSRTPFPQDGDDGVFALSKESRPPAADYVIDREEADSLRDVQLPMPDTPVPPMEEEELDIIKANAQKACAKCPGHCCLAFVLGQSVARMKEMHERNAKSVAELGLEITTFGIDESRKERAADLLREQHDLGFALENFEPLTPQDERSWNYVYKCKKFDPVARRCTAYNERPTLCRRFVCGAATSGNAPTGRLMETKRHPSVLALMRKQDIYDPKLDFGEDRVQSPT